MVRNSVIAVLVGGLMLLIGFAAEHDKNHQYHDPNHNDAFVPGPAGEARIARS